MSAIVTRPATDEEISETNQLLLQHLKPEVHVHTTHGTKYLRKIAFRGSAEHLLQDPTAYARLLDTLSKSKPTGVRSDSGSVTLDNMRYVWRFDYVDSTGFHSMPNGHRVLVITPIKDE